MRRRLLATIAGAVAAAVAVVGLGTLVLTRLDARHRDEEDLSRRVTELAAVVAEVRPTRPRPRHRALRPRRRRRRGRPGRPGAAASLGDER